MQLYDRVALVTGASSGLGEAIARRLAACGAQVIVHGRDTSRTREVARCVGGACIVADLSEADGVSRLVQESLAAFGHIDVVVHNAGCGWSGRFTDMSHDGIDSILATDLTAPIQLTGAVLPSMLQRNRAHLCFITSVAGNTGVPGESVYSAAKAGLGTFADALRVELSQTGVTVSVVVPGVMDTPFFRRSGHRYDRTLPRPMPPDAVAARVVDAIRRDTPQVWAPSWLRAAGITRAAAPRLYESLARRFGEPTRIPRPGV